MRALEHIHVAIWAQRTDDQQAVERAFAHIGCAVAQVTTRVELLALAKSRAIQLVAAAITADFLEPLELFSRPEDAGLLPPVLVLTDAWGTDLYLEALEAGAFDGVCLPIDEKELLRVVSAALHHQLPQVA